MNLFLENLPYDKQDYTKKNHISIYQYHLLVSVNPAGKYGFLIDVQQSRQCVLPVKREPSTCQRLNRRHYQANIRLFADIKLIY